MTPDTIATGKHGERHAKQIEIMTCPAQNMIFMCSRRAGKSEVCCGLLLLTAIRTDDVSCLYLGLTKDAAAPIFRKWRKLLKKFDIPHLSSDSEQFSEFSNGSRVYFTGSDDMRRVTHLLGDQLAGGIAILDEMQSEPGIAQITVEDVLAPMLDETTYDKPTPGRLVLSGSIPDTPSGYMWRTWEEAKTNTAWAPFNFSRFDNPFQLNNEQREKDYCAKYGFNSSEPEVRRRFRGEIVFASSATAYRFDATKHVYQPTAPRVQALGPFACRFADLPPGFDRTIVGIKQAARNGRFAIVAWTWDHRRKDKLLQLAEAVTEPGADPLDSDWLAVCAELRTRYRGGGMEFIRDAEGSSPPVNEALRMTHGITVASAFKTAGATKARVQRLSDLLALGVAKVIEGGYLADCLSTARWNPKTRDAGKWELDVTAQVPAVSDAASIALDLPSYTQMGAPKPPAKPMTMRERLAEEQRKTLDDVLRGKGAKAPTLPAYARMWTPPK